MEMLLPIIESLHPVDLISISSTSRRFREASRERLKTHQDLLNEHCKLDATGSRGRILYIWPLLFSVLQEPFKPFYIRTLELGPRTDKTSLSWRYDSPMGCWTERQFDQHHQAHFKVFEDTIMQSASIPPGAKNEWIEAMRAKDTDPVHALMIANLRYLNKLKVDLEGQGDLFRDTFKGLIGMTPPPAGTQNIEWQHIRAISVKLESFDSALMKIKHMACLPSLRVLEVRDSNLRFAETYPGCSETIGSGCQLTEIAFLESTIDFGFLKYILSPAVRGLEKFAYTTPKIETNHKLNKFRKDIQRDVLLNIAADALKHLVLRYDNTSTSKQDCDAGSLAGFTGLVSLDVDIAMLLRCEFLSNLVAYNEESLLSIFPPSLQSLKLCLDVTYGHEDTERANKFHILLRAMVLKLIKSEESLPNIKTLDIQAELGAFRLPGVGRHTDITWLHGLRKVILERNIELKTADLGWNLSAGRRRMLGLEPGPALAARNIYNRRRPQYDFTWENFSI